MATRRRRRSQVERTEHRSLIGQAAPRKVWHVSGHAAAGERAKQFFDGVTCHANRLESERVRVEQSGQVAGAAAQLIRDVIECAIVGERSRKEASQAGV